MTGSKNILQAWDIRTPEKPVRVFKYKDKMGQVILLEKVLEYFQNCTVILLLFGGMSLYSRNSVISTFFNSFSKCWANNMRKTFKGLCL